MARENGSKRLQVETLRHKEDKRRYIPPAEMEPLLTPEEKAAVRVAYERRNRDLDPQLVWRGKDDQDTADLVVAAPPLYIQEKVHPKVLIEDLKRATRERTKQAPGETIDLFGDFNGLPDKEAATEFYRHDANWTNRMILGDSLAVMASLAEREGLRGKVQCIYFDPPYGIKFNSNFQWSTTSRDVKDGNREHITREPEQVRAFRDTWRDGIHSYLTYLRDRLTVARDLLTESGSIFVQIGDENVHRVRAVMDEVFGDENCVAQIGVRKTSSATSAYVPGVQDFILFYAKNINILKYRQVYISKSRIEFGDSGYGKVQLEEGIRMSLAEALQVRNGELRNEDRVYSQDNLTSQRPPGNFPVDYNGKIYVPKTGYWKTGTTGVDRLIKSWRVDLQGNTLRYVRFFDDFSVYPVSNLWDDISGAVQSRSDPKVYVVQSSVALIQRCILMATDPGDLVLDPTCGSGTTAHVAEQWGRRWITIDTSRVALALARARIMGARYPYYLLADSREGQIKEGEITRTPPKDHPVHGNVRLGFVYDRVPHITLKSIANNAEIDVIWDKWQGELEPLRAEINAALGTDRQEWEIPREPGADWPDAARDLPSRWWKARIARQREIDASIAAKADTEFLYDKPHVDTSKVRVAGPFTVESLSPHRVLAFDADDELVDVLDAAEGKREPSATARDAQDFAAMILENLRSAGVQQAHKEDRIVFTTLTGWPGHFIGAEGVYLEGETRRRAGILIGPEFGTVTRPDLMAAAREAGDAGFDVLIACAFNFDAHSAEVDRLGRIRILKARMNPDLHMAADLKSTGTGNLFVVFGEPDIEIQQSADGQLQVQIKGVDVFHPATGEISSGGPDTIAVWFVDTDYNEESFFVRHAYFLGANDPYKALKTTLKNEIDREAWDSLNRDVSRPFPRPASGRIAVKVINHLGDEVMKVFGV